MSSAPHRVLPFGIPSPVCFALALASGAIGAGCHHARPANIPLPSDQTIPFDPPASFPDVVWTSSLEEARARAADEHKPLIIFVRAAWSRASVVMDSTVWKDSRVLAETPRFVAARIDLTSGYGDSIPAYLKEYDVQSVPTTVIVTSDGRITGRFIAGTGKAADVATALRAAQ